MPTRWAGARRCRCQNKRCWRCRYGLGVIVMLFVAHHSHRRIWQAVRCPPFPPPHLAGCSLPTLSTATFGQPFVIFTFTVHPDGVAFGNQLGEAHSYTIALASLSGGALLHRRACAPVGRRTPTSPRLRTCPEAHSYIAALASLSGGVHCGRSRSAQRARGLRSTQPSVAARRAKRSLCAGVAGC